MKVLRNGSPSGPGPDGVPYSGWAAAIEDAADTLHGAQDELTDGVSPPLPFVTFTAVCAPKGTDDADAVVGVFRAPAHTRPLMLKNAGTKTVECKHYP